MMNQQRLQVRIAVVFPGLMMLVGQSCRRELLELNRRLGAKLNIRVSLDHYSSERHEDERGPGTFRPTLDGLRWLAQNGVTNLSPP